MDVIPPGTSIVCEESRINLGAKESWESLPYKFMMMMSEKRREDYLSLPYEDILGFDREDYIRGLGDPVVDEPAAIDLKHKIVRFMTRTQS